MLGEGPALQRHTSFTPGQQAYPMNMGMGVPPPPMIPTSNPAAGHRPPLQHPMYMQQAMMNPYNFGGYSGEHMMGYGGESVQHMYNFSMNMNTTNPPPPGSQQSNNQ